MLPSVRLPGFGLRTRVALALGLLSMLVALLVAGGTFLFTRSYLINQRETLGITRSAFNARSLDSVIAGGELPGAAMASLPVAGSSQALLRVGDTWYTRGVTVSPDQLPESLVDTTTASQGAHQRFRVGGIPYFGVGVYTASGLYFELYPLTDLEQTLTKAASFLLTLVFAALVLGGGLGRYLGSRVLQPLTRLGRGARRLAAGDLTVRLPYVGDPDLDPISESFNEMAQAVASRIERERRFVANVSHELRSPLTTVVGTAELLESHVGLMTPRDARLVTALARQSRRLSNILLDLLEISSVTARAPVQADATDIGSMIEAILADRNLPAWLLSGARPVVVTDGRRVERIAANLIDNAGKHGGGVKAIAVSAATDAHGETVVRIDVDDAGPGLDAEAAERLFEPFVRGERATEQRVDGAGLGLAIAHEQAQAIGGRLSAGSSAFGGARFTLTITDWTG
ncbi:MAG: ATP-binding protein [Candidatus Nanopelagicales bacterium]